MRKILTWDLEEETLSITTLTAAQQNFVESKAHYINLINVNLDDLDLIRLAIISHCSIGNQIKEIKELLEKKIGVSNA